MTEAVQLKKKKKRHNPWAVIQIGASFQSQNSLASREARSLREQILREEVPRTFICVTMNWGKDNTQSFQVLLDMGSQLILISNVIELHKQHKDDKDIPEQVAWERDLYYRAVQLIN